MNSSTAGVVVVLIFVGAFAALGFLMSERSSLIDKLDESEALRAADQEALRDKANQLAAQQAENQVLGSNMARLQQTATADRAQLELTAGDLAAAKDRIHDLEVQVDACSGGNASDSERLPSGRSLADWLTLAGLMVACVTGSALASLAVTAGRSSAVR